MPVVDNSTPPPEAGGALQRQKLLDAGFSINDVQQWEQGQRQIQMKAGFTPQEMNTYWGDTPPNNSKLVAQTQANVEDAPEVSDPIGMMEAGWQNSVLGIIQTQGKPSVKANPNAPWYSQLAGGAAGEIGDLPTQIVGGVLGFGAGAGAGAETGPGAAVTGVIGASTGAAALTEATREALLQGYNDKGPFTWQDYAQQVGNTAKAMLVGGAVGAAGGAVGGAVGEKVAAATGSKIAAGVANMAGFTAGSTAEQAAIDKHVPSANDFVTSMALGSVFGVLGHWAGTGASRRFQPSPEGLTLMENAQAIYRRTGIRPDELQNLMASDETVRNEVANYNTANGGAIPRLAQYAQALGRTPMGEFGPKKPSGYEPLTPEPSTSKELVPAAEGASEPIPGHMRPEQVPEVQLDIFRELEGSADDAVSPAGAIGRYQIMPGTAREYGFDSALLKDPAYNERAARAILADLNNRFKGNLADIAVAYNAGAGRARAWIRGGRDINSLPPETQQYLRHLESLGGVQDGYVAGHITSALAFENDEASDPEHNMDYDVVEPMKAEEAANMAEEGATPWERTPGGMADDEVANMSDNNVARSIDAMVAPRPALPTWAERLNLGQLWRGFQGELTTAHMIDQAMEKKNTDVGIEDVLRQTYGSQGRAAVSYTKGPVRLDFDQHGNPLYILESDGPSFIKAYDAVKKNGGTFLGFRRWRLAMRTMELQERGIKTGLDPRIAQRYINQDGNFEKYNEGARILQQAKNAALGYGYRAGLWSKEGMEAMMAMGEDHVSLARAIYNDPKYQPFNAYRGFAVKDPLKTISGSERQIMEPETADRDNHNSIFAMADRNVALQYTFDKLSAWNAANPDARFPIELVKLSKAEATREAKAAKAVLDAQKTDDGFELPSELKHVLEPLVSARELMAALKAERGPSDSNRDFVFLRNGEPEAWRVNDPDLAQLLHSEGGFSTEPIPLLLQQFAKLQRTGITSELSFPFRAVFFHGQLAHAVLGEGGSHIPWGDLFHGTVSALWGAKLGGFYKDGWDRFMANGGAQSAMSDLDRNLLPDELAKVFNGHPDLEATKDENGIYRIVPMVHNVVRNPIEAFREMQHIMHTTAQVGSMIAEERKGTTSSARAAMMARKGYLDYAEKLNSRILNGLGRLTPFMTTGFKDVGQVLQGLMDKDRMAIVSTRIALGMVVPSLLIAAANRLADQYIEDPADRYVNAPAWLKDNYWLLPPIMGIRLRIPKPYVIGAIASMSERAFNYIWDEAAGDSSQAGRDWDNVVNGMLGRILPPFMPTPPTPILEQWANKSLYTGAPLVSEKLDRLSGYLQYGPNTSKASIAIAKWFHQMGITDNISPIFLDNYVNQWTGTAPSEFWHQMDGDASQFAPEALRKMGAYDPAEGKFSDHAPKEAADWPIIGNFIVRNWGAGQVLEDYYDRAAQASTARADLQTAIKTHNLEDMRTFAANPLSHFNLQKVNMMLANMRVSVIAVNANKTLSDQEKIKFTDQLYLRMYNIANQYVRQMDRAVELAKERPRE